jgi:hypothetical protein
MKNNVIAWLCRNCEIADCVSDSYFYGEYMGHRVRYTTPDLELQIGNTDFDRWANSVAFKCRLVVTDNISVVITKAILEAKEDNRTPWQRSFSVMSKLKEEHNYEN